MDVRAEKAARFLCDDTGWHVGDIVQNTNTNELGLIAKLQGQRSAYILGEERVLVIDSPGVAAWMFTGVMVEIPIHDEVDVSITTSLPQQQQQKQMYEIFNEIDWEAVRRLVFGGPAPFG